MGEGRREKEHSLEMERSSLRHGKFTRSKCLKFDEIFRVVA